MDSIRDLDGAVRAQADAAPELAALIDVTTLQSMMDDFSAVTHIPMALIDLEGTVIVGAGWQAACTHFHRTNEQTRAHCIASDTILTAGIQAGEMKLYKCQNGMWDAATPIFIGDRRAGNLFTGQFFFDDESIDLESFREQARRYGFEEGPYLAAIQSVPRLSRKTVETGLRFLTNLSSMISQLGYSNVELERAEIELQDALGSQTRSARQLATERGVLQAIIENTDTCLAYLDPDFNFVAVNSTYARGSGHTVDELIGRGHFELFPDADNEATFRRARETGDVLEFRAKPFEFAGQPWRGVTYWDWRLTPIKDDGGVLQGFAFSLLDVTRRVRQQVFSDAINRLDEVIHSNLDFRGILTHVLPELAAAIGSEFVSVALLGPDGRWRVEEVFGLPEELKRRTFTDEQFPAAAAAVRSGPSAVFRFDPETPKSALAETLGIQTMLVASLSVPDRPMGALTFGYLSGPGEFDEFAIDFAGKIAASLSLALNNARLFHEATHTARLSEALATVNEILLSAITVEGVIARLVGEVSEIAGADKSLVIDVRGGAYTITHVRNVAEDVIGVAHDSSYYPAFAAAVSTKAPVLIEDNWNDPRTNKDFVVPHELRAFQLLPMMTQGVVTNVLALAYSSPQVFDDHDCGSAARMSSAMSVALNNARLYENEHLIADRLQDALLAMPEQVEGIEFAHVYNSATQASRVGGDFYDVFPLDHDHVGITIGDVAGKGLNAAVLTSLAKNTIRAHANEPGKTPGRILTLANDTVFRATPDESFVTLFFGILDIRDGQLLYASAGHPAAVVIGATGDLTLLPSTGSILGAFEGLAFEEADTQLSTDEVLFLYTDGLTEARRDGVFYGEERLRDLLSTLRGRDSGEIVEGVLGAVLEFSDGALRDDLALLAIKRQHLPQDG
ncbi:MAG: PocR ligand-binding domain-containing protein [Coriobacteriia bacterium]